MAPAEPLETAMLDPRRSARVAALCGAVVLTAGCVAWFAGFGSTGVETTGTLPREDRPVAALAADVELAAAPQATAMCKADVVVADAAAAAEPEVVATEGTVAELETATAPGSVAAPDQPNIAAVPVEPLMVEAVLADSSQIAAPEVSLVQVALASTSDPVLSDVNEPTAAEAMGSRAMRAKTVDPIEIVGECLVADSCIDQYLWALYQRTLKEDTIKVHERKKVAVKRKGKMVTVTRTFTRLVDQDFTWKDPKAAERIGMPMMDYVIGGMDRSFKTKLFHTLRAAELAGMAPGITSAFRDDYRQSIASGLKAATGRSYHGGSSRGGYGHGLAADIVSVNGATRGQRWVSTEALWKWIDANGKEFGIGRPYLGRDPPHVAPIDGNEYASRRGTKVQQAALDSKKRSRLAMRDDHAAAKTPKKRKVTQAPGPVHRPKHEAVSDRRKMAMAEPGRG
jgi:hypothetical protein